MYECDTKDVIEDGGQIDHGPKVMIIRYCGQCNSDISGEWFGVNDIEYKHLRDLKVCPICGANLLKNKDTYIEIGTENSSMTTRIAIAKDTQPNTKLSQEFLEKFRKAQIGEKLEYEGRLYTKTYEHLLEKYNDRCFESVLEYFRSSRVLINLQKSEMEINEFINQCEVQSGTTINFSEAIKSDSKRLKELLKIIVQTETSIYSVSERLKELYNLRKESSVDALTSVKLFLVKKKSELKTLEQKYNDLFKCKLEEKKSYIVVEEEFVEKPVQPNDPVFPPRPAEPEFKKAGIFNKKKTAIENEEIKSAYNKMLIEYELQCERIKKDYEDKLKEYNKTLSLYKSELKKVEEKRKIEYNQKLNEIEQEISDELCEIKKDIENKANELNELNKRVDEIKTPEIVKDNMVQEEISKCEELLKELYKVRNTIYASGIIFNKYCNFVAVSSFYEYLLSGRCNQLEGIDGAYNIYESEIRLDTIVSQLDHVIESLEKIQKNQFLIYSAIKETKVQLMNLNDSMDKAVSSLSRIERSTLNIEKNTKEIAENTAVAAYYSQVSAYYSKKTAELTDALGFMVALK